MYLFAHREALDVARIALKSAGAGKVTDGFYHIEIVVNLKPFDLTFMMLVHLDFRVYRVGNIDELLGERINHERVFHIIYRRVSVELGEIRRIMIDRRRHRRVENYRTRYAVIDHIFVFAVSDDKIGFHPADYVRNLSHALIVIAADEHVFKPEANVFRADNRGGFFRLFESYFDDFLFA